MACDRQRGGEIGCVITVVVKSNESNLIYFSALDCFAALAMTGPIEYYAG
jgi:hypothetical protein